MEFCSERNFSFNFLFNPSHSIPERLENQTTNLFLPKTFATLKTTVKHSSQCRLYLIRFHLGYLIKYQQTRPKTARCAEIFEPYENNCARNELKKAYSLLELVFVYQMEVLMINYSVYKQCKIDLFGRV